MKIVWICTFMWHVEWRTFLSYLMKWAECFFLTISDTFFHIYRLTGIVHVKLYILFQRKHNIETAFIKSYWKFMCICVFYFILNCITVVLQYFIVFVSVCMCVCVYIYMENSELRAVREGSTVCLRVEERRSPHVFSLFITCGAFRWPDTELSGSCCIRSRILQPQWNNWEPRELLRGESRRVWFWNADIDPLLSLRRK